MAAPTPPHSDRLHKLQTLLTADPHDPFVLYGLAQESAKLGLAADALTYYDRCIAADPAYCYAYFHKARVQADTADLPGALATIDRGIAAAKAARDAKALSELSGLRDELEP